jgi:hypothetical protein
MLSRIETLARKINPDEIEVFVQDRIEFLLSKLYQDLKKCEDLVFSGSKHPNADLVFAGGETTDLSSSAAEPTLFFVQGKILESKTILDWIRRLYFGSEARGLVVGPVGERPLHVCFLRAYALQAAGTDLRIRAGMLKGVRSYLEKHNPDEVHVPYGKDYCAAVGSFALRADGASDAADADADALWQGPQHPPHYSYLRAWARSTYYPSRHEAHREIEHDSRMLVTAGLYEGETVLFFAITGMDVATVDWLLDRGLR